jgi:hypothetical protein
MGIRFEAMMMVGVWKTEIRDAFIVVMHATSTWYRDLWKCTTPEGTQKCPDGVLSVILGHRWETTTIESTVHVLTIKYDE